MSSVIEGDRLPRHCPDLSALQLGNEARRGSCHTQQLHRKQSGRLANVLLPPTLLMHSIKRRPHVCCIVGRIARPWARLARFRAAAPLYARAWTHKCATRPQGAQDGRCWERDGHGGASRRLCNRGTHAGRRRGVVHGWLLSGSQTSVQHHQHRALQQEQNMC